MMKTATSPEVKKSVILLIEANHGYRAAANSLVRRAIKSANLVIADYLPHYEALQYGVNEARYVVVCTNAECALLTETIEVMSRTEEWPCPPVSIDDEEIVCDCSRWTLNSNDCCVNCGRKH
jgi:hypothetical protein